MHWEVRAKLPLVLWMETETKEFEPALQLFSFVLSCFNFCGKAKIFICEDLRKRCLIFTFVVLNPAKILFHKLHFPLFNRATFDWPSVQFYAK